jgi:hypothetical protein
MGTENRTRKGGADVRFRCESIKDIHSGTDYQAHLRTKGVVSEIEWNSRVLTHLALDDIPYFYFMLHYFLIVLCLQLIQFIHLPL